MATFRRRGKKWRVEICHQGNRLSASFTTKVECERWATVTLYELTHNAQHPSVRKTLKEALARYLNECTPKKRGAAREAKFIHRMMQHGICDHLLENVTTTHWAEWRDQRLTSVSPATVIREFTVIKAVYKTAITEWLWLRVSPLTNLKLPKAPPPRDRRVFPEEQQKMLEAFKFTELRTANLLLAHGCLHWKQPCEVAKFSICNGNMSISQSVIYISQQVKTAQNEMYRYQNGQWKFWRYCHAITPPVSKSVQHNGMLIFASIEN